jgi:hypothetical protein
MVALVLKDQLRYNFCLVLGKFQQIHSAFTPPRPKLLTFPDFKDYIPLVQILITFCLPKKCVPLAVTDFIPNGIVKWVG